MHEPIRPITNANATSAARGPLRSVSATHDWTCPFCPLLCDDIEARLSGDHSLAAPATQCTRLAAALARYDASDNVCTPSVDGAPVSLDDALEEASAVLMRARRPLFGGCGTDIAGARALYELAAGCGATLDSVHGDALNAATLALQDRGALFTTLSEVRSRADLLVVFGCEPAARHPRFYERIASGTPMQRDIRFVCGGIDPAASARSDTRAESMLADASPHDVLAIWSALAEGRKPESLENGSGIAIALASLVERIVGARYTAFVIEPDALPQPHAALLIEALHRIVKAINRVCRAGILTLGGADGALSVNQTVTWLSGFPLRTRVSTPDRPPGTPPLDHDPYRYRTERLLAAREADALLWIASFDPHPLPGALHADTPAIVLGAPALASAMTSASSEPRNAKTVFIPVATPGIDSDGHLFRVDTSVVVPLHAARHVALPGVAAIAVQLADQLAAGRAARAALTRRPA
ncbi:formylmethanofuran dehydrogenase [Paraburkholderia phymatum]|uniref:Formyltransferase/hydrolase complex subunit B(FhcB) n=1 Tax=Paraburkholderia phymatum (strain DSM 17167 / CIP 108236 / LMG 21445 / STM815) TaxID=391038 RepID=B2JX57_PARP8|nr:formylmethanofuran dehydrogenase subunit B [Paraburkholderia phymatum]ACC75534.1 formyltransferase/hydrolase complex subunit B(FhcB) [Paraburkholderia phymatum STM815]